MSLISCGAAEASDALAVFYRSVGPNNMSEDQFGGQAQEMGEVCLCCGGSWNNNREKIVWLKMTWGAGACDLVHMIATQDAWEASSSALREVRELLVI